MAEVNETVILEELDIQKNTPLLGSENPIKECFFD